ncbi:ABC-type transport auxiliary lipoprotein family protein [Azospirillum halopraeferens]|uniref:ABC-type transport auxiliary lipoprotein family protein n=1 Tax=Azospirillum halopraeferens TaxID=34010 RepID=UPI0003F687C8|nr:ABC-type transport auxiliary lipoprotein family protein [Azospirillum halopraeferens]
MWRPAAAVLLGLAAVVLGACAAALTPTPPSLYTLTPHRSTAAGLPTADWQLLVEAPTAPAGLDTPRIAVARSPTSLDYFANVSWVDRAPAMVQGLIVESFEDSGRIVSVGRDTVGLRADFTLKTELRDFQAEYTDGRAVGQPQRVRVRIAVKLVATQRRTIEAGETFEAIVPVDGNGFPAVIAAFDVALGRVSEGMVGWTLRRGNAVRGASAS